MAPDLVPTSSHDNHKMASLIGAWQEEKSKTDSSTAGNDRAENLETLPKHMHFITHNKMGGLGCIGHFSVTLKWLFHLSIIGTLKAISRKISPQKIHIRKRKHASEKYCITVPYLLLQLLPKFFYRGGIVVQLVEGLAPRVTYLKLRFALDEPRGRN